MNLLSGKISACTGCGSLIGITNLINTVGKDSIVCLATGCMEITTTKYPDSAWKVPLIHCTFENAASVAAGVKAALELQGNNHTQVIALGGDGAIVDIGFGAVSGAFERNDDILIICYDNEAYSNTGVQRSGSTPQFASTTTSPAGKQQWRKDVPGIAIAHDIPYVATTSIAYLDDFKDKIKKALKIKGCRYIHIHTPCPVGWGFESSETLEIAKLAVESGMWSLYEYVNGKKRTTIKTNKIPVSEYLSKQKRFKHLTEKEVNIIQRKIDSCD